MILCSTLRTAATTPPSRRHIRSQNLHRCVHVLRNAEAAAPRAHGRFGPVLSGNQHWAPVRGTQEGGGQAGCEHTGPSHPRQQHVQEILVNVSATNQALTSTTGDH